MGTNFYLKADTCEHCGRSDERRHIGKSSVGWCFSLHVYPDEGISNLKDWENLLSDPKNKIEDEYGNALSPSVMMELIMDRGSGPSRVPSGYSSWPEFHVRNHSELGPNGLLRHKIGDHCIGHGNGSWDLIVGEFS